MTLQSRDRRALGLLILAVAGALVYYYGSAAAPGPVVVASAGDSVALAEKRLAKLRAEAATVPAKEAILKQVSASLADREKFLIAADTAAQAQGHLIETIRRLVNAETPSIDLRQTQIGAVRPVNDQYGEVAVSVQMECRIDQLVNLLSAIGAQPEMISTTDIRVVSTTSKDKVVGVQLTVSGLVPRRLIPDKASDKGKKAGASL